ncbi:MAG TPA: beta/gamma crystallin domain-containing protein [Candidatus Polarisedimenticolaceae bacterium]|nr:beta/gamma crystallin domain-containing protein [Candidatus Polarisedimenticolaceae bacterium]
MRRFALPLFAMAALLLGLACVVHRTDVVSPSNTDNDCWVKVYESDNFRDTGSSATLRGPLDLATLENLEGKDWDDAIESIEVGPNAEVQVWKSANYAGTALTFQPNQRVENLAKLNFADQIGSLKVVCR